MVFLLGFLNGAGNIKWARFLASQQIHLCKFQSTLSVVYLYYLTCKVRIEKPVIEFSQLKYSFIFSSNLLSRPINRPEAFQEILYTLRHASFLREFGILLFMKPNVLNSHEGILWIVAWYTLPEIRTLSCHMSWIFFGSLHCVAYTLTQNRAKISYLLLFYFNLPNVATFIHKSTTSHISIEPHELDADTWLSISGTISLCSFNNASTSRPNFTKAQ